MFKQQEEDLLAAFRRMHPEDRELLIDFARTRAASCVRPNLSLVRSSLPAERTLLDGAAG